MSDTNIVNDITFSYSGEFDSLKYNDVQAKDHRISAIYEDEEIGFIHFTSFDYQDDKEKNHLVFGFIIVEEFFQRLNLSLMLYKKFGEVYKEYFSDFPIERFFSNPVAEYTFKKAIKLGYIPESAYSEERIKRDYSLDSEEWLKLQNKLDGIEK